MAVLGPVGGNENATPFDDGDRAYFDIVAISISCGWYIDALTIFYQDKTIGDTLPPGDPRLFVTSHGAGYTQVDPSHPVPTPYYFSLAHANGEVLTGFKIGYGAWINTLTIYTSTGRMQTFGGADNHPGPHSTTISVEDSSQQRIYSLKGTSGWYINQLGIYYGPR
jgi:hypothetical protein